MTTSGGTRHSQASWLRISDLELFDFFCYELSCILKRSYVSNQGPSQLYSDFGCKTYRCQSSSERCKLEKQWIRIRNRNPNSALFDCKLENQIPLLIYDSILLINNEILPACIIVSYCLACLW